jgi:hypothetical protein
MPSPTSLRPYLAINRDEVIGLATEALCRELDERSSGIQRGGVQIRQAAATARKVGRPALPHLNGPTDLR